jgi:hypothetical protein
VAILALVPIVVVALLEGGVWLWRRSKGSVPRRIAAGLVLFVGLYVLLMAVAFSLGGVA